MISFRYNQTTPAEQASRSANVNASFQNVVNRTCFSCAITCPACCPYCCRYCSSSPAFRNHAPESVSASVDLEQQQDARTERRLRSARSGPPEHRGAHLCLIGVSQIEKCLKTVCAEDRYREPQHLEDHRWRAELVEERED